MHTLQQIWYLLIDHLCHLMSIFCQWICVVDKNGLSLILSIKVRHKKISNHGLHFFCHWSTYISWRCYFCQQWCVIGDWNICHGIYKEFVIVNEMGGYDMSSLQTWHFVNYMSFTDMALWQVGPNGFYMWTKGGSQKILTTCPGEYFYFYLLQDLFN